MGKIKNITTRNKMPAYLKTVEEYQKAIESPCVIDFTATWCGPCNYIAPIYEKLEAEYSQFSRIKFYKVDVDEADEVSALAGISCMPTFQFFIDGKRVAEQEGASDEDLACQLMSLEEQLQAKMID